MRFLLDTHIALWAVLQTNQLSRETREILLSSDNEIFYSVVSIWEVSLKHSINPDNMTIPAGDFRSLCQDSGFIEIPVDYQHVLGLDLLRQKDGFPVHKAPFDRILLSQAIVEEMHFLTHDSKIATFDSAERFDLSDRILCFFRLPVAQMDQRGDRRSEGEGQHGRILSFVSFAIQTSAIC